MLIGLKKLTDKPWWLKIPKSDPPDAFAVSYKFDNETKTIIESLVPIEVVFVPNYVKKQNWKSNLSDEDNIYYFLNDKKFNYKSYKQGTHLIIYIDCRPH